MAVPDGPAKTPDPGKPLSPEPQQQPPLYDAATTLDASGTSSVAGNQRPDAQKWIGPYRLIRKLGEGGMGQVWLAQQTAPLQRQVALKLIRAGMYDDVLLARFLAERQSLASMDHPSIAKVFDAGATVDGQPYFVMEYVPGERITSYCDAKRLGIRDRLELFIKVCEAVQHAHQKAIIHRDLKPANILVVEVDGKPMPRIIDFGLAKAAVPREAGHTMFTQEGGFVGTRGFMSPEQADPGEQDVDTRTDVYSLGVVLYVLLTGALPFDAEDWGKKPLEEMLRQLREEDPKSPSTKVNTERGVAEAATAPRATNPRDLVSQLRGDLDCITLKALEKDRTRRYASASALAADIRRYLLDEPVTARPPSAVYQARKFVRRHRALAAGFAAVFLALAAGTIVSTSQAIRASRAGRAAIRERDRATQAEQTADLQRNLALRAEQTATSERNRALMERQRADDESARAKAVNEFLENDLLAQASASRQANPDTKPDPDLKVRTALDRAATGIQGKFAGQPIVEASIQQTIGNTYRDLGLYPEAEKHLERAFELRKRVQGEQDAETVASMIDLARIYDEEEKEAQSEALYRKALDIRNRTSGEKSPATLAVERSLAEMYDRRGKHKEAEATYQKVLAVQRETLGEEHADTISTMNDLAALYTNTGKFSDAEALYTKVLDVKRRVVGEEHPDFLSSESDLAELYLSEGKFADAATLYEKLLETEKRVLGPDHPDTLNTMNNLAGAYVGQRKLADAEAMHAATLAAQKRVLGPEHRSTLMSMNNLALVYYRERKFSEAESLWKQALEIQTRVLGEEDTDTLVTMNNLAGIYRVQGKYTDALAMLKRANELQTKVLGPDDPRTLFSLNGMGVMYRTLGNFDQAEQLFKKVVETRHRVLGKEHFDTLDAMDNLGTVYTDEGKFQEADALFSVLLEARHRLQGEEAADTLYTLNEQAWLLREEGKLGDAESLFARLLEIRRRTQGPQDSETADVLVSLGQVRVEEHKYPEAEPLLREALGTYEKTSPESWQRYHCQSLLGMSLAGQTKYAEAETAELAGYQGMVQRAESVPFKTRAAIPDAQEQLVSLYDSWGKPEKAAEWRDTKSAREPVK